MPDATFILPRVVTASDFVRYNGVTGFTPYTGYATDFNTPGTNVSVTAATAVNSSVNINALKRGTSSFAITLGGGVTLGDQFRNDPEHWRHRHLHWRNDCLRLHSRRLLRE